MSRLARHNLTLLKKFDFYIKDTYQQYERMDIVPEAEVEYKKKKIRDETKIFTEHQRLQTVSQPVNIKEQFDTGTMQKRITSKTMTHVYGDDKNYKHTRILTEVINHNLRQSDIEHRAMQELRASIDEEVMTLDLSEIRSKEDILKFACQPTLSNTEKKRRAVALLKVLAKRDIRCRITTEDIRNYRV